MFTLQDVKGIQLERLISYIVERNKQEKKTDPNLAGEQHLQSMAWVEHDSTRLMQGRSRNKHNSSSDSEESSDEDSINEDRIIEDSIKEDHKHYSDIHEGQHQNYHNDSINENNNSELVMLTKPEETKKVKFSEGDVKPSKLKEGVDNSSKANRKSGIREAGEKNRKKRVRQVCGISMKSLMLSLKPHTIDHLKEEFIYNQNRITLEKFIFLMKECISYDKNREYEILYELIKLFEEIDIDSNGFIDWDQFLEYLACYGWINDNQPSTLQKAEKSSKPNYLAEHFLQKHNHRKNHISKILEIQRLDMLCIVEAKSFSLSFLNTRGQKYSVKYQQKSHPRQQSIEGSLSKQSPSPSNQQLTNSNSSVTNEVFQPFSLNHIDHRKVLSIDYSEHEKLFGVLQTDRKVYFVEEGQIQKSWGKLQGVGNEIDIMYLPLHRKWLLRRIDQYLDIFASPKQKLDKERITFKPHETDAITGIKQLSHPLSLITSGIDGKIKIWSLTSRQLLIQLKPMGEEQLLSSSKVKLKGVKGIDTLNLGIQSYFCSWTFTTEIMLWLPSASVSKPYVGKLHGHSGIVESCEFIKPQHCPKELLISIDTKKLMKLWNVERLECLQSVLHQGNGCKIKCLNSRPVVMCYDKIIQFNRLKLGVLMMGVDNSNKDYPKINDKSNVAGGHQQGRYNHSNSPGRVSVNPLQGNQLVQGSSSNQRFIQVEFCTHNTLLLLLLSTQLKTINLKSGTIQAIFEPAYKDEEQFVYMTLKINRRVFVVSNLGLVYYVKIDDGSLIKKIQVSLAARELRTDFFYEGPRNQTRKQSMKRKESSLKKRSNNTHLSLAHTSKRLISELNYSPKFVYYHSPSKILLLILELDESESSLLITYDQASGYEFQKMKEIEFQQSSLVSFHFFNKMDVLLVASESMITIWDWTKLNVVNKIEFKNRPDTYSIYDNEKDLSSSSNSYIQHINTHESANAHLILVFTIKEQFLIYELCASDYSIKQCISLQIPSKLRTSIKSFYFTQTLNEDIQNTVVSKMGAKKSRKNITGPGGKAEKQVKFNFAIQNSNQSNIHNQQGANTSNQRQYEEPNPGRQVANQQLNHRTKGSQQNILVNRTLGNKENKILYITTREGSLVAYNMNDISNLLKRQVHPIHTPKPGQNQLNKTINNPGILLNEPQCQNKKYAAHKIRQTRRANIKMLLNEPNFVEVDLEDHFLFEKELINSGWTTTFGQLYTQLLYSVTEKGDLIFFKPVGDLLGEWNIKAMLPKTWNITYQLLPKVLERLNKLQWILNVYCLPQRPKSSKTLNYITSIPIDGSEPYKVLFLANRYLEQTDLMELREYVKMSTVKILNMSKKNILYKKGYTPGDQKLQRGRDVVSLKKIDDQIAANKRKNLTVSKHKIQIDVDQNNAKKVSSISNLAQSSVNPPKPVAMPHYPMSSFASKRQSSSSPTNLFERKFQQKVYQENRIKVHHKYIERQVEKTLKHAQQLQIITTQKSSQQNNLKLNNMSQKAIARQLQTTKQQARNLLQISNSTHHISKNVPTAGVPQQNNHQTSNNFGSLPISSQMNQFYAEQEMQKKEIQKNIDFVKRIEDSIQKIQMEYGRWGLDPAKAEDQKGCQEFVRNGKPANKVHSQNKKNNQLPVTVKDPKEKHASNHAEQHSTHHQTGPEEGTLLKVGFQKHHRKISIANAISPNNEKNQFSSQNNSSSSVAISTSLKEPQLNLHSTVAVVKKNVEFSNTNRLIIYENESESKLQKHEPQKQKKEAVRQSFVEQKMSKPVRSVSSVSKNHRISNSQNHQSSSNVPAVNSNNRTNLKSASVYKLQQKSEHTPALSKSRSIYGGQITKQRELALNNFKQGMREFEKFNKKFGSWGKDEGNKNMSQHRNKIKLH